MALRNKCKNIIRNLYDFVRYVDIDPIDSTIVFNDLVRTRKCNEVFPDFVKHREIILNELKEINPKIYERLESDSLLKEDRNVIYHVYQRREGYLIRSLNRTLWRNDTWDHFFFNKLP